MPKGSILFRAQHGCASGNQQTENGEEVAIDVPLSSSWMLPTAQHAGDGRANAKGIPFLYTATDPDTALAEMRPWLLAKLTLVELTVLKNCRLIDCSLNITPGVIAELDHRFFDGTNVEPNTAKKESGVWGDIGYHFSKPVDRSEQELDYLPTQVLAESFRDAGYDGIVYKSLLNKHGKNIVFFDTAIAKITRYRLFKLRSIEHQFDEIDGPL
jgi:hypothetical protein